MIFYSSVQLLTVCQFQNITLNVNNRFPISLTYINLFIL